MVLALIAVAMMSIFVIIEVKYGFNPAVIGFVILLVTAAILSVADSILCKGEPGAKRLFKDLILSYFDMYLLFVYVAIISSLPHHSMLIDFSSFLIMLFVVVNAFPIIFDKIGQGRDPPDDLKSIFEEMKAKMGIRKGIRLRLFRSSLMKTALLGGLIRPTVFMNEDLLDALSEGEIRSVLAHELAHYKEGDLIRYLGYTLLMYALLLLLGEIISSLTGMIPVHEPATFLVVVIGFLGALSIFLILIRRREMRADLVAASYTNPEDLINALTKIYGIKEAPSFLPTHPSLEKRIEIIRKAYEEDKIGTKGG